MARAMGDIMKFSTYIAAAMLCAVSLCGPASADVIPPGSYQRTCSDFYSDGTTLSATCRTRFGQRNFTTLRDYHNCDGDIANVSGRLRCVQNDDDDDWVPRGSYRDTCRRERVEDNTLTAECVDRTGRWRYTELQNYRSCTGDIYNANGILGCRRTDDDDDGDDYDLPRGNWRTSCSNHRIYGFVLYAHCRDRSGNWRETSIDLNRCRGDVSNVNGRLVCGAQETFGRITLYVRRNFLGGARTFTGDVPDLNAYGFGNLVSSLIVQGGFWELCDRPNYRGHCIVVSRSQATLYAHGFNDRAESLRRIR